MHAVTPGHEAFEGSQMARHTSASLHTSPFAQRFVAHEPPCPTAPPVRHCVTFAFTGTQVDAYVALNGQSCASALQPSLGSHQPNVVLPSFGAQPSAAGQTVPASATWQGIAQTRDVSWHRYGRAHSKSSTQNTP